jgi:hypothetical protein
VRLDADVLAIYLGLQLDDVWEVGGENMRGPLLVRVQRHVLIDLPLHALQFHALRLLRDVVHLDGSGDLHTGARLEE